ncbi:MAG: ABC transporter permease subunit [Armatimonadota bacterium]|nr:ABC transporter permease subunit [Armatimonadota bacterium]
MRAILLIASLTLKETLRRRLWVASLLASLAVVGFVFVAKLGASVRANDPIVQSVVPRITLILGLDVVKFFGSVMAMTLASGAIALEIERGMLYAILYKPLHRYQVVLGKWLGVLVFALLNTLFWTVLLYASIRLMMGKTYLETWRAPLVVLLYPVLFGTLTLFFSTFASMGLTVALSIISAGIAWSEKPMREFGMVFDIETLVNVANNVRWIVPMNHLRRWVLEELSVVIPERMLMSQRFQAFESPPAGWEVGYVFGYVLAVLMLAVLVFGRRDV